MTAATTATANDVKNLNLKIGEYTLHPIPTGLFALDGGAMFGTVPKVMWQKSNPPDELNRIPMEARALLLKSKNRNILIDVGNGADFVAKYGEKLGQKFAEIYGVDSGGTNINSSLKKYGLTPDDITDVILTHLHFDHAGGATKSENGRIVPTFPKAIYHLQNSNYQTAIQPNIREKASYLPANFKPLIESGVLKLIDGAQKEYFPGISLHISNGHTVGHQVVVIEDELQQAIYCGDVIPTSSHIRSAWIMGYDLNPLMIIQEKSVLLKMSETKTTYLFFEHDPYCDMATVEANNGDYKAKERFTLS